MYLGETRKKEFLFWVDTFWVSQMMWLHGGLFKAKLIIFINSLFMCEVHHKYVTVIIPFTGIMTNDIIQLTLDP